MPDIGIHKNVPPAEYHSWPEVSNSRLRLLAECPALLKHDSEHPTEPSDAMMLGTALHTMLLEPQTVADRIAVAPEVDRRTKQGRELWTAFCDGAKGKLCVDREEFELLSNMARAVMDKSEAATLLRGFEGDGELSAVWLDIDTGVRCKARIDRLVTFPDPAGPQKYAVIMDLKTTSSADPADIAWACREFGYDRQAAFYLHGLAALNVMCDAFYFVFVSKAPPHFVTVCEIEEADVERARREIVEDLATYKQCQESGVWPQHTNGIIKISVPPRRRGA
jgi:hypothetical protein